MDFYFKLKFPGWNVGKSAQILTEKSKDKSSHACAKYIREALEAGGISTAGHPINAKEYHTKNFLLNKNFKLIKTITSYKEALDQKGVLGDIAVMTSPSGGDGHICMWNGEQWVSDFKQNRLYPYQSSGNDFGIWIYRWNGDEWLAKNSVNDATLSTLNIS